MKHLPLLLSILVACSNPSGPVHNPRDVDVDIVYNTATIEWFDPPILHLTGTITNVDSVPCSIEITLSCVAGTFIGDVYAGKLGYPIRILPAGAEAYWAVVAWGRGLTPYTVEFVCLETSMPITR